MWEKVKTKTGKSRDKDGRKSGESREKDGMKKRRKILYNNHVQGGGHAGRITARGEKSGGNRFGESGFRKKKDKKKKEAKKKKLL